MREKGLWVQILIIPLNPVFRNISYIPFPPPLSMPGCAATGYLPPTQRAPGIWPTVGPEACGAVRNRLGL